MRRTPLAPLHDAHGVRWVPVGDREAPAAYGSVETDYARLRSGAGLADLSHHQRLLVTGRDRKSWLHGQVTQDVLGLPDWRAAPAVILTPQGKMVADLRIYNTPEALLVEAPPGTSSPLPEYLERYLIMERAEITDLGEGWVQLALAGPGASGAAGAVFGEAVQGLGEWEVSEARLAGGPVLAARVPRFGEDGIDLFLRASEAAEAWGRLCEAGAAPVGMEALRLRQIEAGIPAWGAELDETVVPPEARLDSAVSLQKGCYVGQEILARIDARGHVNHLLAGFRLAGDDVPPPGAEVWVGEKKVGRITSAARTPGLPHPAALGYLRREYQAPGTQVRIRWAGGEAAAEVAALPFL